jgi:CxxC motif-containing protein (DUF1111 family)
MFALRLLRRRRLRIRHALGVARGVRGAALLVWRAVTPRLGAMSVSVPALAGQVTSRGLLFVWRAGMLCLGAISVSAPALAVSHDDSAAISHPSTTTAAAAPPTDAVPIGTQPFTDHRNPPSYRKLSDAEFARYDLGMAAFNTQFVPAGTPNAGRRAGVGPLFNSTACDGCHNNGAHGRGPTGDGPAPTPLVIELATTPTKNPTDPEGDPVYGRVLNTVALDGIPPEGAAMIRYQETPGHYPDGATWSLRVPHYTLTNLHYGPLSPRTLVKPRLAPALFGVGLLDAAATNTTGVGTAGLEAAAVHVAAPGTAGPETAAGHAAAPGTAGLGVSAFTQAHGRFGWQATALSVQDQTARAFAREMGLTSSDQPTDDCTQAETACLHASGNASPEVSADIFSAVLSFQRYLAVPASPTPHAIPDGDANTFADVGCSACHRPRLSVTLTDADGKEVSAVIAPYTDLRLHDLGSRLADETVGGKKVPSKFRTAPLWGLGYRMSLEHFPTFLHDGRARSAEEAILWHDGEAANARTRFEQLPAPQRKAFLHWLETL